MIGNDRNPGLVLLLSIITCGIYYFVYIYEVSKETGDFLRQSDMSPGTEVLLTIITCGLWNLVWDYKIGKRIATMNAMVGRPAGDNSVLYLILDIVGLGIINAVIQQNDLNNIWQAARSYQQQPYYQQPSNQYPPYNQ